jgi:hypothetical protein
MVDVPKEGEKPEGLRSGAGCNGHSSSTVDYIGELPGIAIQNLSFGGVAKFYRRKRLRSARSREILPNFRRAGCRL